MVRLLVWGMMWILVASVGVGQDTGAGTADAPVELGIGGTGGVYFLAMPGELTIDLVKRDRNRRGRHTDLRAILVGPDRRVLQEVTLPDDGRPRGSGMGPPQRARLATRVERTGVYALNITVSQDRYGEEIVWGFRTNCPHYLIETARGHRDQRHQEPIVLWNPGQPGNVCFMPRAGRLTIDVEQIPKGIQTLQVFDGRGALIGTLAVGSDGRASYTFAAGEHRDAVPWRLHLPVQQAVVHIDGVTRWSDEDLYPNLCCWTPKPESFFPLLEYRWLLTPYRRTVYGQPGSRGEIVFRVHNHSPKQRTIGLGLEFPGEPWPVQLSVERVVLRPKQDRSISLRYTVPSEGQERACSVRATPQDGSGFSTYSTLTVRGGTAPATRPLAMPIMLKPYEHENEQFGYMPDYPIENQVYFDLSNRPFVRVRHGMATWRAGQWEQTNLGSAVRSDEPELDRCDFGIACTKIAFDRDNDVYLLGRAGRRVALLHSADGGKSFTAYRIPGREDRPRSFDMEQFSGHNSPETPPPLLRYTRTAEDARLIWRKIHDLELFVPEKRDGRIVLGEPILISRRCIGLAAHSGIPSTVVSRGDKVHVVWAEATEPDAKVPGVPTYVVTYDRHTRRLGKPARVAYGPPANDIHNTPSITMDSRGYLHVLAGTHGRPFPYARSLEPNDAGGGWTEARVTGGGLRQTYIGLVCGADDTLHTVFRLWRTGQAPFPASTHATLAYQRKRPGQPWEKPRVLVVSAFSEYSVFYHRLTIDRAGRLFLSYDYWSTYWFYRNDHRGSRRALLMSADGGDTWKLVETRDFGS